MSDLDVVVVGSGSAGMEAGVAAAAHGAGKVVVLEKAPFEQSGGNARMSHTGFRIPFTDNAEIRPFLPDLSDEEFDQLVFRPYTVDEYYDDVMRVSEAEAHPGMARTLAENAKEAVQWMREMGISWAPNSSLPGPNGRRYFPKGMALQAGGGSGGGKKQLAEWRAIATGLGVEMEYEAGVVGLSRNPDGSFDVEVQAGPDTTRTIRARNVVLASGGFQASRERRLERMGPVAANMLVHGSRHNTGEVMDFAFGLGAGRSGEWGGANVCPVDGSFGDVELGNKSNRYSYPVGITVNARGERFFDEGESTHAYTYSTFGWALANQPGAVGYQIFDAQTFPFLKHYAYDFATPVVAGTIAELAEKLGIPADALEKTVAEYNAATPDTPPFDPTLEDGRAASGLAVPKSNWAVPLAVPPFRAYQATTAIVFTYGGLKVDEHARVLDDDDQPIEGLYASGDILGIFSRNYPSGAGQTRNVVFSLAAGRHIGRSR